jgi:hypothetical protein
MASKDSFRSVRRWRSRQGLIALTAAAVAALVAGVVVGGGGEDDGGGPGRSAAAQRVSFLARVAPPLDERKSSAGPSVPRSIADLARRLPLERKVAQVFLWGFQGQDLQADIYT